MVSVSEPGQKPQLEKDENSSIVATPRRKSNRRYDALMLIAINDKRSTLRLAALTNTN